MKKRIVLLLILGALFSACKKASNTPNSGIYEGSFKVYASNGGIIHTSSVSLSLHESNNNFVCEIDSTQFSPYQYGGTFLVDGATTMQFDASVGTSATPSLNYYLDTTYIYTFDDQNLTLTQTRDTNTFEYTLVRY